MDNYSREIVDNMKQEPPRHFVLIMSNKSEPITEDQKSTKSRELRINLEKFDKNLTTESKLFNSYFVCKTCDFVSQGLSSLTRHLSERKKQHCMFCEQTFTSQCKRRKHALEKHFDSSRWQCSKCSYSTQDDTNLKQHYPMHLKKFSCSTCNYKFAKKEQLKNHQQLHLHGVYTSQQSMKFECDKCEKSYATAQGLRYHKRNVHGESNFHCDLCAKNFGSKEKIYRHVQTHSKIPCPICQHLVSKRLLGIHLESHSTSDSFECKTCSKFYKTRKRFRAHERDVHEVEKVQCDICGWVCKNKSLLRQHLEIHIKFPCQFCQKMITKEAMKRHIKSIHPTGEFALNCKIKQCPQRFLSVQELDEHQRIHLGPKHYKCPKCDQETKIWSNMKRHLKSKSH